MNLRWIKLFIIIIGALFIFNYTLAARDKSSNFKLNAGVSIYTQQEKSPNYFLYPTPETEILYKINMSRTLSVFTGLRYIYSYSHHDLGYKSEWRRKSHELAFPLFLEQGIGKFISVEGGTVIGYLIKGKEEYKDNIPAHKKWIDITDQTDYNESSRFYIELFLNPKLKYDLDTRNILSIGPTVKYYITDNWMRSVRCMTMFGISFQYSFWL